MRLRNNRPFSDPVHAGKVDSVLAPIEQYILEAAAGEYTVDERNRPVIYDPSEDEWRIVADVWGNVCWLFGLLEATHKWSETQPPGLRQLAKKFDYGTPLFPSDFPPALETVAWMRRMIADVTPNQWSDAHQLAEKIQDERNGRTEHAVQA